MAHRIGQNYTESTKDALQEQPHLRGRLGAVRWHELQKDGSRFLNGDGFESAYDAMPNYASGNTGHIPTNLWTLCQKDDQSHEDTRCPLKAYPLSCSDYGSLCLDNCCADEYSVCNRHGYGYDDNIFLNAANGDYHRNKYHSGNRPSKSCCSSCSKGGQYECERKSHYSVSEKLSKACCTSCSKGGPCERGRRSAYKLSKQASKACCSSCAQGGPCESDRKSQYQQAKQPSILSYSSGSSGGSHDDLRGSETSRPSYCMFKFQEREGTPYRKCGVIPNYMGYIPGLQMTYGEPYGITANRLLQRHFSEQENRHY